MRSVPRIGLIACLVCLMGCVSAQVTRLGSIDSYPPVAPSDVQVFLVESDVPGPFTKVALIRLKGDADWTNETAMVNKAKQEAGKLGANALILGKTDEPGTGAKIAASIFGVSANRRGEVVAIRFERAAPESKTP
jgi:hypothetical protein